MVGEVLVSIGQVKRDISDLVNRVAYRRERIILTSRGKPKAVLISIEDYELLKQARPADDVAHWQAWLAASEQLGHRIMERRGGQYLEVDELLESMRKDREERDGGATGN